MGCGVKFNLAVIHRKCDIVRAMNGKERWRWIRTLRNLRQHHQPSSQMPSIRECPFLRRSKMPRCSSTMIRLIQMKRKLNSLCVTRHVVMFAGSNEEGEKS
ncbi:uncharacterized protein [Physcomitrium patens]|uniref:uncharacterized protein isoform X2 n=1 Tax=Physcomitrium patens TaxID=3218 RepID=UPI003CCC97AE